MSNNPIGAITSGVSTYSAAIQNIANSTKKAAASNKKSDNSNGSH